MTKLAIFASGKGSNAENIIKFFRNNEDGKVAMIVCNNPEAGVIAVAKKYDVPLVLVSRKSFFESNELLNILQEHRIDFIALAGFLWLLPQYLLENFHNKILNVHPALLPQFGGKGMFGERVHRKVIAAGEKESGISIHYVNENYDEGEIIFQAKCDVEEDDDATSLSKKVNELEHYYYPRIIEQILKNSTEYRIPSTETKGNLPNTQYQLPNTKK